MERTPPPRLATIRKQILFLLETEECSARDISAEIGIPEKAVYDHLSHLRRSLQSEGRKLHLTPASCLACDFVFTKRDRLNPPGRCPACRSTHLSDPLFSVR